MGEDKGEVTLLLKAMQSGDPTAHEKLLPLVYKELHRLAETYMGRERPATPYSLRLSLMRHTSD